METAKACSPNLEHLADRYPILSKHWGLHPQSTCSKAPPHIRDLRLQRDIEKLHQLGPRAIYEMLDEIGCRHSCRAFIEDRASRYAELDPAIIKELGGDNFPVPVLHEVQP